MSFLKILGLQKDDKPAEDADTVREISRKLDRLDPAVAAYHALFACILSRVAHADLVVSEEETRKMEGGRRSARSPTNWRSNAPILSPSARVSGITWPY